MRPGRVSQIVVPPVAATCCSTGRTHDDPFRATGSLSRHLVLARDLCVCQPWLRCRTTSDSRRDAERVGQADPTGHAVRRRPASLSRPGRSGQISGRGRRGRSITAYRRRVDDKGVPQDWWYGHYLFLKGSSQERRSIGGAKRFSLVVIDREDWQVEPVLEVLGTTLRRALR